MISLAERYYLVINDRFELFYRGVIKAYNPSSKYVKATCKKGYTYPRYFTYTPKEGDEGEYTLTISIYDDEGHVLESKDTILVVNKPVAPKRKVNILCVGDSLTYNGVWAYEGYRRYTQEGEEPNCLGFKDTLNLFGKCKKEVGEYKIGYEGYGGWQWKTFCTDMANSPTSSLWVTCNHNKTDEDQHSVWECEGLEWILESIEENKLKFKRGSGNNAVSPKLSPVFKHVKNAANTEDIVCLKQEFNEGNPFWNKETNNIDFKNYVLENGFPNPDYVFILLTWNGQANPYNTDFSIHKEYASKFIKQIHSDFPKAKVICMGIQLVCPIGGITACYGADGFYHDWYGEVITAFNYNEWLEQLLNSNEFKDYCLYSDMKAQFDSEYNMPYKMMKVNNRSNQMERIGINGIHPSMDGYLQIGDVFYRTLVHVLNKFENEE